MKPLNPVFSNRLDVSHQVGRATNQFHISPEKGYMRVRLSSLHIYGWVGFRLLRTPPESIAAFDWLSGENLTFRKETLTSQGLERHR